MKKYLIPIFAAILTPFIVLAVYQTIDTTNVSITGGTITGITDLTVADGGTGQSSFTAGNLLYGAGGGALQNTATTTLTASAPLALSQPISVIGGTASALTCTAASASAAGCLSAANWTAFNNKWDLASSTIGVAYGGTGATTLTDGGVLLGSGTGAITAMGVLADGAIVIGDGTTDPTTLSAFTASNGYLKHEYGGLEFNLSAITAGGLIRGASAGAMEILALGTGGQLLGSTGGNLGYIATSTMPLVGDIGGTLGATTISADSVDDTMIDWGTGANQVSIADLSGNQISGALVWDFGGATSLEIPNNGTVDTNGEITSDDTSGQLRYYAGSTERVISPFVTMMGGYATSTWNGTTTLYLAPAIAAGTIDGVYCETDTGTVGVSLYDASSNRANYIPTASTTINYNKYSSNNTFTAGESIRIDLGTPASSPTKVSCRFKYKYSAD